MLIPLTRESFEELIPLIATGPQYLYFWGKFSDLLKRLLISVVGVVILLIVANYLAETLKPFLFIVGIFMGFYWLWGRGWFCRLRSGVSARWRRESVQQTVIWRRPLSPLRQIQTLSD